MYFKKTKVGVNNLIFFGCKDYIQIHYACNEGKKSLSRSHPGSFCVSLSHVLKSFLFGETEEDSFFFLMFFMPVLSTFRSPWMGPLALIKKVRDDTEKKALLWWLISQLFFSHPKCCIFKTSNHSVWKSPKSLCFENTQQLRPFLVIFKHFLKSISVQRNTLLLEENPPAVENGFQFKDFAARHHPFLFGFQRFQPS